MFASHLEGDLDDISLNSIIHPVCNLRAIQIHPVVEPDLSRDPMRYALESMMVSYDGTQ